MTDTPPQPARSWLRPRLAVALWLGCLALAGWLTWAALHGPTRDPLCSADPPAPTCEPQTVPAPAGLAHPTLLPPGTTALDDVPGQLPLPDGASTLLAYRRKEEQATTDTAVYQLPASCRPGQLADWYHRLLTERGYHRLGPPPADGPVNCVYLKTAHRLLLRIVRRTHAVRLVLQLRYTRAPSS